MVRNPTEMTLDSLLELIRRLRADDGCPWDRRQTLASVRAYLLEEAHETAGAIDEGDLERVVEELGDLLFQVAFVGVLVEEASEYRLRDAVAGVHAKMVARHPHVFGDRAGHQPADADAVARAWEVRKARRESDGEVSILAGVPSSLPSLVAAYRLSQKAAGVGFDWPDLRGVVAKVREELAEVEEAVAELGEADEVAGGDGDRDVLAGEVGDLLFAVANLARHLRLDPDAALAGTNRKFRRRFAEVEEGLRKLGVEPGEADLDTMEGLWQAAKDGETVDPAGSD